MNPPLLHSIPVDHTLLEASGLERDTLSAFFVARAGTFEGRWWEEGDVVLCVHPAEVGGTAVFVPVGHGRPVPGRVREGGLFGPVGERCHPVRWRVAGAVAGLWRQVGGQWRCMGRGEALVLPSRGREVWSREQLGLFDLPLAA